MSTSTQSTLVPPSAPTAGLGIHQPDPTGYRCPQCDARHPARGAMRGHVPPCPWCRNWVRRMARAYDAARVEARVAYDAAHPVSAGDYAGLWARLQNAQAVSMIAAADARRAVLTIAIAACEQARAEMAVAS